MYSHQPALIACRSVGYSFDDIPVFTNIGFSIRRGDRFALVGENGSGKSTLIKLLSGELTPDVGTIWKKPKIKIGVLPQSFDEMAHLAAASFAEQTNKLARDDFSLIKRLQLTPDIFHRTLGECSGGEKVKVALFALLRSRCDIYLLDEPTNNIDNEALEVLSDFVSHSKAAFVIASHDRAFLDRTVNRVIELDRHNKCGVCYEGNYSTYRDQHRRRIERKWADYNKHIEKINRLKDTTEEKLRWTKQIEKTRHANKRLSKYEREKPEAARLRDKEGRMSHRAAVLKRRLEVATEATPGRPPYDLPLEIVLTQCLPSSECVFRLDNVTIGYPSVKTVGPLSLKIMRGERIHIAGSNGCGKSTLIKLLAGKHLQQSGRFSTARNTIVGYLPQENDLPSKTIGREFLVSSTESDEGALRRYLHRLNCSTNLLSRPIATLSSGERSRLLIGILGFRAPNVLLLDEPTNHIDIDVLEALESALGQYAGTLVFASHDKYFIERIQPTRTILFE